MKTAIYALVSGSLMFSALATNAQGNSIASINPVPYTVGNYVPDGELASTEVNAVALTNFNRNNKDASSVLWTQNGSLVSVYFHKDGVRSRSTYNEKGRLEYTLRYLTIDQAPRDVRYVVNGEYKGIKVVNITEINRKNFTYYFVKFEDATSFFTIQITNGEFELFETIKK